MSSSGLGSLILRSKGVMQNGDVWIPATPEKPVLQRPNHGQQPEVTQNQMLGSDNWNDLVGLYTGFLQEPSDGTHQTGNPNNLVGPNSREYSMRQQQQQISVPTRVPGLSQGLNTRDVRCMENYTGVLQSGPCVMPPQKLNPGNIVSLNNREHNIRLQQQHSNPIGLPGLSHGLSTLNNREHNIRLHKQHSNPIGIPGMSHGLNILNNREHNIRPQQQHSGATGLSGLSHGLNSRSVGHIENYNGQSQNFNPNGNIEGSNVTHVQNMGEIVPQKVNSLAELMGMMSSMHDPTPNGALGRSTYAVGKPGTVCPQSQGVSNNGDYTSRDAMLQQDHVLHANRDNGGYNLQETPNCKLSTPFWPNLNLPPRPEVRQSSSAPRPLQIGPVTPDQQKQSNNHQTNLVPHLLIDEISAQETHNKQDNVVLSSPPGILEREQNELLQNSSGGGNEGIDLNTTPQQKTHKKRKHRPKVVVEGKPKKTPKRSTAKKSNTTPEGNPTPKRKYVRKNGVKTSNTPLTDPALVVEGSNEEPPAKSCKRVLNFDLDSGAEKEGQGREFHNTEASKLPLNLNLDIHNAEWSTILVGPSTSGIKDGHQNTYRKGKQREITNDFSPSIAKTTPQESQQQEHTVPPPTPRGHPLNAIARSFNVRNASLNKSGALVQLVSRANTSEPNLESRRQAMLQNTMSQLLQDVVDVTEKQESKREYAHTAQGQPQTVPLMGSRLWYPRVHITGHSNGCSSKVSQNESQLWANEVSGTSYSNGVGSKLMQINSETGKKETVEDEINGTLSGQPSGVMSFEDLLGQSQSRDKSSPVESSIVHQRGGSINSCTNGASTSRNSSYISNVTCNWNMNSQDIRHKFQQQRNSSQVNLCAREMVQKTSHQLAKEQTTNYLTQVTNWILESASNRDNTSTLTNEILIPPDRVAVKKRTAGQASSKKVSIMDKNLLQDTKNQRRYWHYSKKVAGSQEMINLFSVDYITDRMNYLNINKDKGKEKVSEEQTALVPFRGEGALIPYEDFDPVKRRRPRPRVDLDPETNRLWNLLMGKEGSETAEAMDSDKQKWWEEERKVFRGRVDSFIARMHLVQGDRRFSKWKGSVVDSVIGVFLTQNVSDHLSSSAFMCLAAKFPLKPKTISPSVADHEVRVTFPDGTTPYDHKMTTEPAYNYSSVTSTEPSEYRAENDMKGKRAFTSNMRADEDLISSQSSSESFVFQPSEDNKSSSGSNSEAEDGWNLSNKQGFLNVSQQAERNAALQQFQFQLMGSAFPDIRPSTSHQQVENPVYRKNLGPATSSSVHPYPFTSSVPHHQSVITPPSDSWPSMSMGLERWEAQILANSGKENMSYLASQIDSVTSSTGVGCLHGNVGCLHDNIGQSAQSSFTERQNFQPSVGHTIPNKNLNLQTDLPDAQRFIKHRQGGIQETSQQESTVLTGPKIPGIQNRSDTITFEPTDMGQVDSSEKAPSKTTTTPNEKKRKAAKEKAEPFDWDFLRKQVLWKAGTRERSKDAMDSLDYEALRAADVREISDTIKERGMNNMLAERIKDFLNRLVRDHEKMDLEWLRDVQPDKAKDYLLSIRGLGLKSVECVRLLTLHHLAFPVDTNVGRIAVRLGWVPLQPLPESLQLHLLELYPVLETIQKYLWPRLCKLDQETLYELHYQMITFGKVFCTKRDPNCNACPMRAECRHFASAFASARLALPGPEERRIVTSTASTSANKSSDVVIKPMALLPGEDNLERGTGLTRNCEPVIEEPTTPEPPIEVSERDIEDAFYEEDPDEIPEIKLSVEEFTTNLQSFMQGHMEMGEADMSKALVALSPGLNSIPTPKLKQVSRLRTEHQVYVLPDSHPLLEGMDRREPDDPSPYLLAIWTPGETADSVQPPESTCCSEEGGFCNKKTCFSCDSRREAQAQTVRGTILIPCRTAMRGSFPLNGTYFQVNEVFADHESSLNPIDVPRSLIWDLPRGTVYFGTSVSTIFKGLPTEGIQYCFWKGYVCVRGFDQKTRAPRPLKARLHFPASKMVKQNK